ncbi:MAG: tRNA lysidine(34) synthetase TilS [Xanthomonadaceae bacterium]|nr:tRNA lysidine(34) synthetase TilS [Xanthomonadaceae bacterium]MDE1884615.1 tRNA lysidine(34) synthetase TilS [Xanthomonadaceae bacterium]MDE1960045.1 tRNA lysidine(34) synthetase TilS [Xanthomonadaceae bacterium]MDE2084104.1 tRNA lysidine(34) synthetase TilS [Xanthomonadaceae bacterium]MDE2256412.1 tRNA lysidine(34) synthetase TilS [Xanthomonadaceae bacterium]
MTVLITLQDGLARLPSGALAVAFSGGMDSSVLLHALARLPGARTRGLRAIHVNHGLHADSDRWAAHCRESAAALDVPLHIAAAQVDQGGSTGLEDAARRARFAAFAAALQPGEILALAQHRGDQAETVLLKLLRGAGPQGLGAMRGLRKHGNGYLWRPLLDVSRAMVFEYAQQNGLYWVDDPSNAQTHLSRNFLRHEIIPRLTQHWPHAEAALVHSATWLRAAADYIDAQSAAALAGLRGAEPATLDWRGWLALPDALRDPVLRSWLRECGLDEPAHFHVAELERQLLAAQDRTPCVAFEGTELRRLRDRLCAFRRDGTRCVPRPD